MHGSVLVVGCVARAFLGRGDKALGMAIRFEGVKYLFF